MLTPDKTTNYSEACDGKATTGSSNWCIMDLSLDARSGIGGVYSTVGECGTIDQWKGTNNYRILLPLFFLICAIFKGIMHSNSLQHFLDCGARYHAKLTKDARKGRKRKKREKKKDDTNFDEEKIASHSRKKVRNDGEDTNIECDNVDLGSRVSLHDVCSKAMGESSHGDMLMALQSRLLRAHSEVEKLLKLLHKVLLLIKLTYLY